MPPNSSMWTTRSCVCRPRRHGGAEGRGPRPPRQGNQQVGLLAAGLREAGTGGDVDEAIAKARRTASSSGSTASSALPFMEPRSTVVDPTGEQVTMWTSTQVPHPALPHRRDDRYAGEQDRVIAPDGAAGSAASSDTRRRFITLAVARRWANRRSTPRPGRVVAVRAPRPRPVPDAHPRGDQGRHRHRPQRSTCSNLGAYVAIVGGVPVLGRGCSTRSTSSRHTSSTARRSRRTPPGWTPTAAPADLRRPSPSSG